MKEYTQGNHFRFGYDGDLDFRNRVRSNQIWQASYGPCTRRIQGWRMANLIAARRIAENAGDNPIVILFSGGIDSEIALLAFLDAGIKVECAVMKFENDSNLHDIGFAFEFCQRRGLTFRIYDLNVKKFFESGEMFDYALPVGCVSPQLACTMWLVDQINGFPVLGQGEPHLRKSVGDDFIRGGPYSDAPWCLREHERVCSWQRHFIRQGLDGVPGFHQYTPEQLLSFLNIPLVQELINDKLEDEIMMKVTKWRIYSSEYPTLANRPKYTGFEKLLDIDAEYRKQLNSILSYHDQFYATPINDLLQNLKRI